MLRTFRRSTAHYVLLARKVRAKVFPPAAPASASAQLPLPDSAGLAQKVILITGSSRGIGLALAKAFAQAGSTVIITGRTQPQLDAARDSQFSTSTRC